jgi:hypothetical protein
MSAVLERLAERKARAVADLLAELTWAEADDLDRLATEALALAEGTRRRWEHILERLRVAAVGWADEVAAELRGRIDSARRALASWLALARQMAGDAAPRRDEVERAAAELEGWAPEALRFCDFVQQPLPFPPVSPEEKERRRKDAEAFLRGEPSGYMDVREIIARLQRGEPVDPDEGAGGAARQH